MKRQKKLCYVFCTVLLTGAALAGCGNEAAIEEAKSVKLNFYYGGYTRVSSVWLSADPSGENPVYGNPRVVIKDGTGAIDLYELTDSMIAGRPWTGSGAYFISVRLVNGNKLDYYVSKHEVRIHRAVTEIGFNGNFVFQKAERFMVLINGGTFMMGSPAGEPERASNETQHQVTVSSFYMGNEVTQEEYQEIMGTNPSGIRGEANLPVETVSWYDAVDYCNRLSQKEGLTPAYNGTVWNKNANGYRLPTEAEWEYACRAGTTTPFNTGNNITTSQANYNGNYPYNNNAKGPYRQRTTPVGSFAPNPWGLYDMHGNVWEWCGDWYGGYSSGPQTDPAGPSSGSYRVGRGGTWNGEAKDIRSAYRGIFTPSSGGNLIGFRLVRPCP